VKRVIRSYHPVRYGSLFKLAEADGYDSIDLHIEQGDGRELAVLLSLLGHIILDVVVGFGVFFQREGMLRCRL
jgi:hypothetical protein